MNCSWGSCRNERRDHAAVDRQALRRRGRRRRRVAGDAGRRVLHDARAVRLREDDDAAADRGVREARRRRRAARRRGRVEPAAAQAPAEHGLPVLRAVPAHDGRRQRGVRAALPAGDEGREGAPGRRGDVDGAVERAGGAPARAAFRGPAAAGGSGTGARAGATGAAARRAARRAGRPAARRSPGRAQADPGDARDHVHLRHARSGRGAHDERPRGGHARRQDRAVRDAPRPVRGAGDRVRGELPRRVEPDPGPRRRRCARARGLQAAGRGAQRRGRGDRDDPARARPDRGAWLLRREPGAGDGRGGRLSRLPPGAARAARIGRARARGPAERRLGDRVLAGRRGRGVVARGLPSGLGVMSTRDALLDATRRVISRSGFAATTVGEITREAVASLGLLHYHFESKDEVVAEAFAQAAREDLAELRAISLRHEDPADRLAAFLDQSEWQDQDSWRLWVDAWGESVHTPLVRDTLGRFDVGWRAVLAELIADGVRRGRWECADPQDTAGRLVAVLDGIGLHTTVHGEDVPPERAASWARRPRGPAAAGARRRAGLELGVSLPSAPAPVPPVVSRRHETRIAIRSRDLDASGHVDPAVLFTYLEEARDAWLGDRLPGVVVSHVTVDYRRPLGRGDDVVVACELDAIGRASFRTRETVIAGGAIAVEAATTLETPGRALTSAERQALTT